MVAKHTKNIEIKNGTSLPLEFAQTVHITPTAETKTTVGDRDRIHSELDVVFEKVVQLRRVVEAIERRVRLLEMGQETSTDDECSAK